MTTRGRKTAQSTGATPFGQALRQIVQLAKANVGLQVALSDVGAGVGGLLQLPPATSGA